MPEAKRPNQTDMAVRHIRMTEQFLIKHQMIESLPNILMGVPYRINRKFQQYIYADEIQSSLSTQGDLRAQQIDNLWNEWRQTYDPYSGENLAGVASYQAGRYGIKNFPKEETREYERIVKVMDRWGQNIKLLIIDMGEEKALGFLKKSDAASRDS
jgi:hypothetical protein